MDKVIIILDGSSEGKTTFTQTIKKAGFWTWNVNPYNVLSMLTYKIGYEGERNKEYYDFINRLKELADGLFDFERHYITQMIEKFLKDDVKADVLVLHKCSADLSVEIQDFYPNCYNVLVSSGDSENENYCRVLNFSTPDYVDEIIKVMKILTNSKEK